MRERVALLADVDSRFGFLEKKSLSVSVKVGSPLREHECVLKLEILWTKYEHSVSKRRQH